MLLVLIPLFLGPTAGVYFGGVKRARLDDRRQLLRVWFPWVTQCFHLKPPELPEEQHRSFSPGPPPAPFATLSDLAGMNRIIRLLPVADRFLWNRVIMSLLRHLDRADLLWALANHDARRFKTEWVERHTSAYKSIVEREYRAIMSEALSDLEHYFLIRTNQPAFHRLRSLRLISRTIWRSKRDAAVRRTSPLMMTIQSQVSATSDSTDGNTAPRDDRPVSAPVDSSGAVRSGQATTVHQLDELERSSDE